MSATKHIALIGDYDATVIAHQAIPGALKLAGEAAGRQVTWQWVGTDTISDPGSAVAGFSGVWVVPASPYKRMEGALAVIRHARVNQVPILGTCGGFQHMLVEFARNVAGIAGADHAETNPGAAEPVVSQLACSLVGTTGDISFKPGSLLHALFAGRPSHEGYRCAYGLNSAYRARLETAGLHFTGFDAAGEVRAGELPSHPFFFGTLFQPERSSLRGATHPLVLAFVESL
jgi:CTP synthase (UTP-ammonia lyase)